MKKTTLLFFLLIIGYQSIAQNTFYFFNAKGKKKSTLQADLIKKGAGDYCIVYSEGKYGIYNYKKRKITTEIIYRDLDISENGLAKAKDKHEKWGIIQAANTKDKTVLPFEYFEIQQLDERYYSVTKFDRKSGVFDAIENRFIIDCQYDTRIGMQDEVFTIRHNGLYALYGKNGQIVMPFQKQTFKTDSENHLINIRRNNKTLLFNTQTLEYQSELEFDEFPVEFINGFAKINKKGKYGFLIISGEMITEFEYDSVKDFNKFGFAQVQKNEKFGVIDTTGKVVIPINFTEKDCPKVIDNGLYIVKEEGSFGLKRLDGNWLLALDYKSIRLNRGYVIAIKKDDTYQNFNYEGELIYEHQKDTTEPVTKRFRPFENITFGWSKNKGIIGLGYLYKFDYKTINIINLSKSAFAVTNNNAIVPIKFPYLTIEGKIKIIFVQKSDGFWVAYNKKGKQIIKPKYTEIIILNDGWSIMKE